MNVLTLRSQVNSRRKVLIWITLLALGLALLGSPLPADGSILPYTMQVLSIEGAQGDMLPAHLYIPTGSVPEGGFPAVVLFIPGNESVGV
jgi:dipeptidyl aminopeptidase/acylaminoacyl peptidase